MRPKMTRHEWMQRRTEFAKRGSALPQSKLTEQAVADIKSAIRQRDALRKHLRDNLSNQALAKAHGVHVRTIERVAQCYTWSHVA